MEAHKSHQMSKKMVDFSKYLSFVLRHGASEVGVTMDKQGFVTVSELLATKKAKGYTMEDLKLVVDNNNKKRFEMIEVEDADKKTKTLKIRAVQGHTINGLDEESLFDEIKNPEEIPFVIHGTDFKAWINFIRFQGLKRMARNHIHFAIGYNSDSKVISGMRNSSDIVIEVDSARAIKDGYKFLRSKNDVILCPGKGPEGALPPAYFKSVTYMRKPQGKGQQTTEVKLDLTPFEYLLILDFEANCVETGGLVCQEVIEFPVVPIDVKNLKIMEDKIFHTYVKPTVVKEITPFCTGLTGITQAQVDAGITLEETLAKLDKYMADNGFNSTNSTIVTCGRWDLATCLKNEANYKKIHLKDYLKKFINIKDAYMAMNFLSKAHGMPGMLSTYNLTLDGKHHSGIDDSKNIAKICIELLKQKAAFTPQQEIIVADKASKGGEEMEMDEKPEEK